MSSVNSFYMADVIFDGIDGEMKGINIFGDNFQDLIENIEKKSDEVGKVEIWSALLIYGAQEETAQVKIKVIETLRARNICTI